MDYHGEDLVTDDAFLDYSEELGFFKEYNFDEKPAKYFFKLASALFGLKISIYEVHGAQLVLCDCHEVKTPVITEPYRECSLIIYDKDEELYDVWMKEKA